MEVEERRALGELSEPWDRLVLEGAIPSPFLRSWWIDHAAIGEPVVLVCRDDGELVGGLALQRTRRAGVEWLEMLGDGPLEPDHLDLVARPDRRAGVRDAILGWAGRPGSRVFDLAGLVPDGDLAGCVPGRGRRHALPPAPYASLPDDLSAYLAGRDGRLRSTVQRSGKRLTKAGVTTRFRSGDDASAALEELHRLHDDRWGERSGFMGAWEAFAAAARAGASTGEVEFGELVDDRGEVIATEVDFVVGDRVSFYQAGRRDDRELRGSGSVLKAAIIERAVERGCREYDLLRGDEDYKGQWADQRRPLVRIRHGVGPLGVALVAAAEANLAVQERIVAPWRRRRAERARAEPSAAATEPGDTVTS